MSKNHGHHKGGGGNSHQRAVAKRAETTEEPVAVDSLSVAVPEKWEKAPHESKQGRLEREAEEVRKQKWNEVLNLVGFAATIGSWGWTVIAPDSSIVFGSVLLLVAVVALVAAVVRAWSPGPIFAVFIAIVALGCFGVFDWNIIIAPQRGREFKQLLVSGYHLEDECGNRSAAEPLPSWLHDDMTSWYAKVEQLISQRLDYKYLQMWRGSSVVGFVSDANITAYQCTGLSVKVGALETVISNNYDPKLGHQEYEGPLYWLESLDGKVDISEALKHGGARITIHKGGGDTQVTGKLPTN